MLKASRCRKLGSFWFALMLACLCAGFAPVAMAQRLFRLQPAINTVWTLQSTTDVNIQMKLLAAKVGNYSERETVHAKLVVERVDPNGSAELVLVIERVEVSQNIVGNGDKEAVVLFDSSAPKPPEPSRRWTDLADRSSASIGVPHRLVLKPNGEMAVKDPKEEKQLAAKKERTCPPSPSLEFAERLDPRNLICLPDRPVSIGAAWHHDPTRSEVVKLRESGQAPVAKIFGLGRGKEVQSGESKYVGPEATVRGQVEKIATSFAEDQSGLFRDLGHRAKCVGELAFDSMNGELVEAKWDIVAKDKGGQWLGTVAMNFDLHTVVTLVRASAPVPPQAPGIIPLPPVR